MPDRRLAVEMRLAEVRSDGGTMSDLIRIPAEVVGGPAYLLHPDGRVVTRYVPSTVDSAAIPRLDLLLASIGSMGEPPLTAAIAPADRHSDHVHVIAPIVDAGRLLAYMILAASRNVDQDELRWLADRACVHLKGEFLAQRRLARVGWNARANLGRQMIRGTKYDADLRACAEYLGVDLDAERLIVFVLERARPSSSAVDPIRLSELMAQELRVEILPIRGSEGVLLAVSVPEGGDDPQFISRVKGAAIRGLARMGDDLAVAGVSAVAHPGHLRRAYREAREVARCLDRYARPGTRVISCDELGPARLFVANSDEHAVRLFVYDVMGPLLNGGDAMVTLLVTLQAYFEAGRNIRETANMLGVHENTVRHRLGKVQELTGMDVLANSNHQLTVHTAMLVLRLQGHHAVPAFDRGAPAEQPNPTLEHEVAP